MLFTVNQQTIEYLIVRTLADALRDIGVVTWNIDARITMEVVGPKHLNVVAHTANYLRKIASKYSFNLNHIIIVGHSEGGHLALCLLRGIDCYLITNCMCNNQ
jgi:acetyl esterase/lipase